MWNEGVTIPQVEHMDAKLVVTVCNKRAMGRCDILFLLRAIASFYY